MAILTKDEAKLYLRIDPDETGDDNEVTALIMAAEAYLVNAGCILNAEDELAKLAEKMLVSHWYENREPVGIATKLVYGLQSIILQLQLLDDGTTT